MAAGISRETWERSVERYTQAPYCEYVKERGDEVLFLSKNITAVRLSDESTYLVHPLYMMQFDTHKIIVEVTENVLRDCGNDLIFKDSNQLALISDGLMRIFNENKYVLKDQEKINRIEQLVAVGKERFYDKIRTNYSSTASKLPVPHPSMDKIKNYMPSQRF